MDRSTTSVGTNVGLSSTKSRRGKLGGKPSMLSSKMGRSRLTNKANMSTRSRRVRGSGMSKSGRSSSHRRKNEARVEFNGMDVTPKSLLANLDPAQATGNTGSAFASMANIMMQSPKVGGTVTGGTQTQTEDSGTTTTGLQTGLTTQFSNAETDLAAAQMQSAQSAQQYVIHGDKPKVTLDGRNILPDGTIEPLPEQEVVRKPLTKAELQEQVFIEIKETETTMLMEIPGIRVWKEDEETHKEVEERNAVYDDIVEKHKEKDKYIHRHAQTFNLSQRNKKLQAERAATCEVGVSASTWDIYDAYAEDDKDEEEDEEELTSKIRAVPADQAVDLASPGAPTASTANQTQSYLASGGSSMMVDASAQAQPAANFIQQQEHPLEKVFKLEGFASALTAVEQALVQNETHRKQVLYRKPADNPLDAHSADKLRAAGDMDENRVPGQLRKVDRSNAGLNSLWSYKCHLTEGLRVTCMDWNKQNTDLLAAGYGSIDFGKKKPGLVLFWTLKNPTYPAKIIHTKCSVTSLDFCGDHPHLLAVGLYDGTVCVYDLRDDTENPGLESLHATGKHSEPVWGLKWVTKGGTKRGQQLTSISSDGSVLQWSMKKGLVPHELMLLKRIPNRAAFQGTHMEGISREASGLCFDFPIHDGTQYMAGTEDGIIHKCSVSYNEQTLENYYGHTGPVYKVRCSPFLADAFLSCSADWTCALWSSRLTVPILQFHSGTDYVTDINWSPGNSTVFASVTRDGRLEVWDLDYSPLDPIIRHQFENRKSYTSVVFSPDSPVILTGAQDGSIDVYRVNGVGISETDQQQATRLDEAMYAHNENKDAAPHTMQGDEAAKAK